MIAPNTRNPLLAFNIIWIGELISLIGSGLSNFALAVWTYQNSGSITLFTLIALAGMLPAVLLSPIAGSVVDRWDRRMILILSNIGLAVIMGVLAILIFTHLLALWCIYLAVILGSVLSTFVRPAFSSSITVLVPEEQFGQANGRMQLANAISQFIAPVLAGVLLVTIQLQGVVLLDFVSFLFAIGTLALVAIPKPAKKSSEGEAEEESFWKEVANGWRYIVKDAGLLALVIFAALFNFLGAIPSVLIQPLILNFSSAAGLGLVMTLGGTGMLVGSLALSLWRGPKKRINLLFVGLAVCGLCLVVAGLQPSLVLVTIGAFFFFFSLPAINTTIATVLQQKVAPDFQGRVFALSSMFGVSLTPLAYVLAGLLSDRVFEPLLQPHGLLAPSVGQIVGVGAGRGIGLLFILVGLLLIMLTFGGYLYPRLRHIEDEPSEGPAQVQLQELTEA